MATYTTNYNLEKPAQTDIYNVDVFNANADKIDAGLTDKAEKTMLAPVETTNSASRSYAKGEYFVYNNVLCCATTAIAAGGTIAIGTNCSTAPVGGELKSLRDALSSFKCLAAESVTISTTATTRTLPATSVCMVLLVSGDNSVVSGLWFFRVGTASLQMFEIKKGSETAISTSGLTFSITKATSSRASTLMIYQLSNVI